MGRLEQLRQLRLGQPDRLVLEPALDAHPRGLGLIEDQARRWRRIVRRHFERSPIMATKRSPRTRIELFGISE